MHAVVIRFVNAIVQHLEIAFPNAGTTQRAVFTFAVIGTVYFFHVPFFIGYGFTKRQYGFVAPGTFVPVQFGVVIEQTAIHAGSLAARKVRCHASCIASGVPGWSTGGMACWPSTLGEARFARSASRHRFGEKRFARGAGKKKRGWRCLRISHPRWRTPGRGPRPV